MSSALGKSGVFVMAILMGAMICSVNAMAGSSLYSTLGPGGQYDNSGGVLVEGSNFSNEVIANPFTLNSGGFVSNALLALANVQGNNSPLNVYIESNNGGMPGSIIAQLTQSGTITSLGGLVNFTCSGNACGLTPGSYWLVAVESDPNSSQGWFFSNGDQQGNIAYNLNGSATGPWSELSYTLEAFQIDTPEPNSLLIILSGLASAGYGLRRKLL